MMLRWLFCLSVILNFSLSAQQTNTSKFKQLKEELPTPNSYRTASGAPGHAYYQQKADYKIDVKLNEQNLTISGEEIITYTNNSPDRLDYLWLQLDQNIRSADSDKQNAVETKIEKRLSEKKVRAITHPFDGGFNIHYVQDENNQPLNYFINKTMMRVNLPTPLKSGEQVVLKIKWDYKLQDRIKYWGRSGYEFFEDDGNYIFSIGQFFPRMAVYNDVEGWQHKQFLGRSEFALPFGDYEVNMTIPDDHILAATGVLQNPEEVLTAKQRNLLAEAKSAKQPVIIVNEQEANQNSRSKSKGYKTWKYKAENVRDFAFSSSRKFIWDAWGVPQGDEVVMAMSLYPKESKSLFEKYSTKLIAHTIEVYNKYTFEYPYPVAWSVSAKSLGMEYPMICFNWGRTEADGTYSEKERTNTIRVIIHEIGHNYIPMILNVDERQWSWMDEGLNSFLQFLAEKEFEPQFPSYRGYPYRALPYMKLAKDRQTPLMTNPESIIHLGAHSYVKASVALNILRETIMGRELFDFAFKTFAERWKFKHPTPADFFRTMEDASGMDLDWFWRGWYYTTDNVDIALEKVEWFKMSNNPADKKAYDKKATEDKTINITDKRNKENWKDTYLVRDPSLQDFYYTYDKFAPTFNDELAYSHFKQMLTDEQRKLYDEDKNFYQLTFKNIGGLVMPLIVEFEFKNGKKEVVRIPAEIWVQNNNEVTKVFAFDEEVVSIALDPFKETADVDMNNNYWPPKLEPTRFELYLKRKSNSTNPMQKAK